MNSQTLVALNNTEDRQKYGTVARKVNSFDVGVELGMSLVKPYMAVRDISSMSKTNLHKSFMATSDVKYMNAILKLGSPSSSLDLAFKGQKANPPKKCGRCIVELPPGPRGGKVNNTLGKLNSLCEQCGTVRCIKKHLTKFCDSCVNRLSFE